MFYLISKGDEYRMTQRISETFIANHVRHGWDIVSSWSQKPTPNVIKQEVFLDRQMVM
jgi:hypothetical protein